MLRLAGRVALVTGAGSGIGAACAARLQADGAKVYSVDRAGAVLRSADVTSPGISELLVSETLAHFGALDILVPCAGISAFEPLDGHSDAFWEATLAVNVTAVFRLVRASVRPVW